MELKITLSSDTVVYVTVMAVIGKRAARNKILVSGGWHQRTIGTTEASARLAAWRPAQVVIKAVLDLVSGTPGAVAKGVELLALTDVPDLSLFSVGIATTGADRTAWKSSFGNDRWPKVSHSGCSATGCNLPSISNRLLQT